MSVADRWRCMVGDIAGASFDLYTTGSFDVIIVFCNELCQQMENSPVEITPVEVEETDVIIIFEFTSHFCTVLS